MYKEIETYIQRSADRYETIIIYGAGIWAERIVDWLSQAGNNKQLLAVVDQCGSSKIGKKIGLYTVEAFSAKHYACDAIIIASYSYESVIEERILKCLEKRNSKPKFIRISDAFPEKAYTNSEYIEYVRYIQKNYNFDKNEFIDMNSEAYIRQKDDPKIIAWYLPQYYQIDINDKFHGKGFTEWTNVSKAIPLFKGHKQPHIPYDLGFYRLEDVNTLRRQAELARLYGVYGFCFHYYWFSGKRIMEKPLNTLLAHKEINISFCINWAMHNWNCTWGADDYDLIFEQKYHPEDAKAFIKDVVPLFYDERYIKIEGKPVISFYWIAAIGVDNFKEMINVFREEVKKYGFSDIYVMVCDCEHFDFDVAKIGADALVEYAPNTISRRFREFKVDGYIDPRFKGKIWDAKEFLSSKRYMNPVNAKEYYRSALVGFDNTARRLKLSSWIIYGLDSDIYKKWLKDLILESKKIHTPEKNYVFVASWNEWAEGSHLEPDLRSGYAYLKATREAIEECR